jgi:MFS family permease
MTPMRHKRPFSVSLRWLSAKTGGFPSPAPTSVSPDRKARAGLVTAVSKPGVGVEGSFDARSDRNRGPIVVVLLALLMVINFADKAVVGIAAVPIMQELELGPRQFGLVGSSFFLLFALSSVAVGFLANRVPTRWILLAMGFTWALTLFPVVGPVGFHTLVACRIALEAGEGPATPVALHSVYKWFPNVRRTLPTAVIVQGGAIGVIVALPLLNWIIVRWTWHWAFGALGLIGLATDARRRAAFGDLRHQQCDRR